MEVKRVKGFVISIGTVVLLGALILLLCLYLFGAQGARMNSLAHEIESIEARILEISQDARRYFEYLRERDILLAKVEAANRIIPEKSDVSEMLEFLEDSAVRNGVEIVEVIPGRAERKDGFSTISMKMDFRGSYSDVIGFISELERAERPVLIKSLAIDSGLGVGGKDKYDDEIIVNAEIMSLFGGSEGGD